MAEPQDSQQPSRSALAATWPNPPPFFEEFTEEKIERYRQFVENHPNAPKGDDSVPVTRIANIPADLVNLQPPAEPEDGRWRVFGDHYSLDDKLPELEEQGIQRLGAHTTHHDDQGKETRHQDRAFELKRLAKSLLLNYLELLGILSIDPVQAEAKIADLRTLFINFHHALNEYRPHQARESTIAMMQEHLDRTRAETAAVRASVDRTKRVIEGLASLEVPAPPSGKEAAAVDVAVAGGSGGEKQGREEEGRRGREMEIWSVADELVA